MSRRKRLSESLDAGIHGGFGHSQVLLFSTVDEFRRTAEDEAVKEGGHLWKEESLNPPPPMGMTNMPRTVCVSTL